MALVRQNGPGKDAEHTSVLQIARRTWQSMYEGPVPADAVLLQEPWIPQVVQWVRGPDDPEVQQYTRALRPHYIATRWEWVGREAIRFQCCGQTHLMRKMRFVTPCCGKIIRGICGRP